jgi:hypothetical protein
MEQAWRKGQMEIKGIKIADDSRGFGEERRSFIIIEYAQYEEAV